MAIARLLTIGCMPDDRVVICFLQPLLSVH